MKITRSRLHKIMHTTNKQTHKTKHGLLVVNYNTKRKYMGMGMGLKLHNKTLKYYNL